MTMIVILVMQRTQLSRRSQPRAARADHGNGSRPCGRQMHTFPWSFYLFVFPSECFFFSCPAGGPPDKQNHVTPEEANRRRKRFAKSLENITPAPEEVLSRSFEKAPSWDGQRVLRVCICGAPNAGKSVLLNKLIKKVHFVDFVVHACNLAGNVPLASALFHVGPVLKHLCIAIIYELHIDFYLYRLQRISAVSSKYHTTRDNTLGVYTEGDVQIEFLDTPGYIDHAKSPKFNRTLLQHTSSAVPHADLCLFVIDAARKIRTDSREYGWTTISNLCNLAAMSGSETWIVLNKCDLVKRKGILKRFVNYLKRRVHKSERQKLALTGDGDQVSVASNLKYALLHGDDDNDDNDEWNSDSGVSDDEDEVCLTPLPFSAELPPSTSRR
jgi:GTP-binding protein EngB required for normal cell division